MTEPLPNQLLQPSGPGHDLLAGPVAFYLTYQAQIEAWSALRKDLTTQMTNWYLDVLASRIKFDGWVRSGDRTQVMFALQGRSEDLTVGLMWDKGAPTKPYVGVSAATEDASARFMAALGGTRPVGYQRYQWGLPVWRWLVRANSSTAWWTDLATHIDWLVYEISAEMDMFRTAILAATSAGAEPTTPTPP